MEYAVLGWPEDEPTLRLDYRRFAYAGKFVMSNTGKAVVRDASAGGPTEPGADSEPRVSSADHADGAVAAGDASDDADTDDATDAAGTDDATDAADFDTDVVAALAFNADRTDAATLWYRYVTVRADRKGAGLGPRLARYVAPQAAAQGYERLRIAVNNPFAYEAMYKAGFAWTGRETGVAELVLERPAGDAAASETADPTTYQRGLDRYRDRDLGDPEASFLAGRIGSDPPAVVAAPESAAGSAPDPDA